MCQSDEYEKDAESRGEDTGSGTLILRGPHERTICPWRTFIASDRTREARVRGRRHGHHSTCPCDVMQAVYTVDRWTPQAYSHMFATALLHWRRADARAVSGSLGEASARGAADPYALWPRRGAGSAFARDAAKKVAAVATIVIVGNFTVTSKCAATRVVLRARCARLS